MNKNSSADFIEIMFERGFIHQITDKQNLIELLLHVSNLVCKFRVREFVVRRCQVILKKLFVLHLIVQK